MQLTLLASNLCAHTWLLAEKGAIDLEPKVCLVGVTKMEPALILGLCRVVVLAWLSLIIKPPPFTHTQVGCNTIICGMTFFWSGFGQGGRRPSLAPFRLRPLSY